VANLPETPQYVLIGAPHTSNMDFPLALLLMAALGAHFTWIGKDSLFKWPFGILMKSLGGIPVDRSRRNHFVNQMVAAFRQQADLKIVIAPEGTRGRTESWKSGFYYIALGAGVPIALGFLDYRRKIGGIGSYITPTGDIQADLIPIREFYTGIQGKFPHQQGEIRIHQTGSKDLSKG
jgi:1-acyl-sn-glycerol-3-phosphate acyltransferase